MNVDEVKGATAVLADHDHSHSGEEFDICAPFCMCSCCAANINLVQINYVETEEPTHNTLLISQYIERPMLDRLSSIWQPPRA